MAGSNFIAVSSHKKNKNPISSIKTGPSKKKALKSKFILLSF